MVNNRPAKKNRTMVKINEKDVMCVIFVLKFQIFRKQHVSNNLKPNFEKMVAIQCLLHGKVCNIFDFNVVVTAAVSECRIQYFLYYYWCVTLLTIIITNLNKKNNTHLQGWTKV